MIRNQKVLLCYRVVHKVQVCPFLPVLPVCQVSRHHRHLHLFRISRSNQVVRVFPDFRFFPQDRAVPTGQKLRRLPGILLVLEVRRVHLGPAILAVLEARDNQVVRLVRVVPLVLGLPYTQQDLYILTDTGSRILDLRIFSRFDLAIFYSFY